MDWITATKQFWKKRNKRKLPKTHLRLNKDIQRHCDCVIVRRKILIEELKIVEPQQVEDRFC